MQCDSPLSKSRSTVSCQCCQRLSRKDFAPFHVFWHSHVAGTAPYKKPYPMTAYLPGDLFREPSIAIVPNPIWSAPTSIIINIIDLSIFLVDALYPHSSPGIPSRRFTVSHISQTVVHLLKLFSAGAWSCLMACPTVFVGATHSYSL